MQSISELATGIKLNVYGRGKTGKTRFACTFPKPLMIIATEDGTKSIKPDPNIKYIRIHKAGEIDGLVEILVEDKYKTCVFDTAGGLQDIVMKEVLGLDEIPVQKSWGMAHKQDWGAIASQTKQRLRQVLNLSDTHGLHSVIIAHERNFNDDENQSDMILPTVGAALTPQTAGWVNGACDYICQTYIREKSKLVETKVGNQTVKTRELVGGMEYCLRIGPHPVYMTGFRNQEELDEDLPDSIVNPSYQQIIDIINGKYKKGAKPQTASRK